MLQLAGDAFADEVDLRRRALDLVFAAYMREQVQQQQTLQRRSKLTAAGATAKGTARTATAAAAAAAGVFVCDV
jgi:hypothetical protein